MNRRIVITFLPSLILIGIVALYWPLQTVDSVMADFYNNDSHRAEDMLIDPLILHADLVTDRVIEKIKDPDMTKRRYAITFLGVIQAPEALPALRKILSTDTEIDYFRADALESIYRISSVEGLRLAVQYQGLNDYLGYVAKGLINGSHKLFERTYPQALVGYHE